MSTTILTAIADATEQMSLVNNNINNNNNQSVNNIILEAKPNTIIISNIIIWIYIVGFIFIGLLANIVILRTLFKIHCNGTLYILMQLCFCDIGTLLIAGIELFYINHSKWISHIELCPIYLGIESFACTATYYFIIAINLHGLSTWNLTMKTIEKDLYLQQESDNDNYTDSDVDDGQTQSDDLKDDKGNNSNNNNNDHNNNDNYEVALSHRQRSLTIDYRKRKLNISVMLPVIFIWFLAASISIPFFVFGNVLPNNEQPKLCGIINFDQDNNLLMQLLILIIRIGLPSLFFLITLTFVIIKLYFTKIRLHQCGLDENAAAILQLSFIISMTFLIFSIQHIYGSLLFEILSKPFGQYKYPKFNRIYGLILSMIHYFLSCLRPFIYFYYDKSVRDETKLFFKLKLMKIDDRK